MKLYVTKITDRRSFQATVHLISYTSHEKHLKFNAFPKNVLFIFKILYSWNYFKTRAGQFSHNIDKSFE